MPNDFQGLPNLQVKDPRFYEMVAQLMQDSNLESECTKLLLAETVATLHLTMGKILHKAETEPTSTETLKMLPAFASNIKRLCDSLGVNRPREEELGFQEAVDY